MLTTRDERIEKTREIACDSLGVVRDSLMNSELRHTDNEREMLLSLAARLVLQAIDNDVAELGRALSSIRQVLELTTPISPAHIERDAMLGSATGRLQAEPGQAGRATRAPCPPPSFPAFPCVRLST